LARVGFEDFGSEVKLPLDKAPATHGQLQSPYAVQDAGVHFFAAVCHQAFADLESSQRDQISRVRCVLHCLMAEQCFPIISRPLAFVWIQQIYGHGDGSRGFLDQGQDTVGQAIANKGSTAKTTLGAMIA
jgi:hypothetical protein